MADSSSTTLADGMSHSVLHGELISHLTEHAVFLIDLSGKLISWNPGVKSLLGYSRRDFVGQPASMIFTLADQGRGLESQERERAIQEGRIADVRWHRKQDGTGVYADSLLVAVKDPAGQVLYFGKILQDATERHRAEERLQNALDYAAGIIATMHEPLLVLDSQLRVQLGNRCYYQTFQASPADTVGKALHELGNGQFDVPSLHDLLEDVLLHNTAIDDFDVEFEIPNVGYKAVSLNARKLCQGTNETDLVLLTLEDITKRKVSERTLAESEARYELVARATNDVIWDWDLRTDRVRWNPVVEDVFGYAAQEVGPLIGWWRERIHPEERARVVEGLARSIQACEENWSAEYRFRHADGSYTPVFDRGYIVHDEKGRGVRMVGSIQDLTARKRSEEERERLLQELERSNGELSQFAYVASHDLQAPLRMVTAYTQLLARHLQSQLDEKGQTFMNMVLDGAGTMQELVQALLRYAQVGQDEPIRTPIPAELVIQTALVNLELLRVETEGQITHEELPVIVGDKLQLLQLFQNLFGNALKYRKPMEPPRIHVAAEERESEWLFSVTDNGQGIDERDFEKVFVPLKRLHGKEVPGTGIGLAICRKIVERHGGRIWVESEVGQGSVFYFTLRR